MKFSAIFTAAAMLAVAACGRAEQAPEQATTTEEPQPAQQEQGEAHSGTGTVTAVAGDQVTIRHGPIQSIGWPEMTMTFTAPGDVAAGVGPGSEIEFSFRDDGGTYVLTSVRQR